MFFLRFVIFLMILLGVLVYLVSRKIRAEFLRTGDDIIPNFQGSRAEYKAFCKMPPTPQATKLLSLRKKFSIALSVCGLLFLLTILIAVLEQA